MAGAGTAQLLAGRPGSVPGTDFFFATGFGAHSASYPMDTEGSFPGDKAAGK